MMKRRFSAIETSYSSKFVNLEMTVISVETNLTLDLITIKPRFQNTWILEIGQRRTTVLNSKKSVLKTRLIIV